jgi:hypothetical protein
VTARHFARERRAIGQRTLSAILDGQYAARLDAVVAILVLGLGLDGVNELIGHGLGH